VPDLVKMTIERRQHHFIYAQRLVVLAVTSVDFSNLCCIICQRWEFRKWGKSPSCVFCLKFGRL